MCIIAIPFVCQLSSIHRTMICRRESKLSWHLYLRGTGRRELVYFVPEHHPEDVSDTVIHHDVKVGRDLWCCMSDSL